MPQPNPRRIDQSPVKIFVLILLLVILGLAANLKRLFDMADSHRDIEEEWTELQNLIDFQGNLNGLISYFSFHTILQSPSMDILLQQIHAGQVSLEKINTKTSLLNKAEGAILDSHDNKETVFLEALTNAYVQFAEDIQEYASAAKFRWRPEKIEKSLSGLRQIQALVFNLQGIYIDGMKKGLSVADTARRQVINQTVFISILIVLFLLITALASLLFFKKRTQEIVEEEKLITIGALTQHLMHEIRNPLGIIKSSASLLEKNLQGQPMEQELAGYMIEEVDRIDDLMNQMLSLEGRNGLITQAENMGTIIEQVLKFWDSEIKKLHLHITFHNESGEALVNCNRDQIKQVLINLLLNAMQASADGGQIVICTLSDTMHCTVSVQDFGKGMTKEEIAKIFNPFYSTKQKGLGLGLAIVKRILDKHHAQIQVQSKPGQGTTFTILFPRHDR